MLKLQETPNPRGTGREREEKMKEREREGEGEGVHFTSSLISFFRFPSRSLVFI